MLPDGVKDIPTPMSQPVTGVQDTDLVLSGDDLVREGRGHLLVLDLVSGGSYAEDLPFESCTSVCPYPYSSVTTDFVDSVDSWSMSKERGTQIW